MLTLAAPAAADDFSQGASVNAAPNWKVYNYNPSGQAYATSVATSFSTGIGFGFLSAPNTAFFMTGQQKDLLGDLTGKTITATFTISASSDAAFTYYGAPGACGTCMDARGVTDADLLAGAHRSSMAELAAWTAWAEKVVTF